MGSIFFYRIVYVEKLLVLECTFESNVWQQQHQLAKLATTTKIDCETIADVNQNHAVPIALSAHPLIKYISIFKMKIIYWHFRRDAEAFYFVSGSVNKQLQR